MFYFQQGILIFFFHWHLTIESRYRSSEMVSLVETVFDCTTRCLCYLLCTCSLASWRFHKVSTSGVVSSLESQMLALLIWKEPIGNGLFSIELNTAFDCVTSGFVAWPVERIPQSTSGVMISCLSLIFCVYLIWKSRMKWCLWYH